MKRKRNLDFIINESDTERLIFRFYPRLSSCHSFDNEPPKSWNEVYKVYYNYRILKQSKLNKDDKWEPQIMFKEDCDECSIIDEVGARCKLLADDIEVFKGANGKEIQLLNNTIMPFGMGTNWTISKYEYVDFDGNRQCVYKFVLFDYFNVGYKFELQKKQLKDFGQYLLDCCEYMLQHGESI